MTWKNTLYMPEICKALLSPCSLPGRCGTRACTEGRQPSPSTCHLSCHTIHNGFPWHPDILMLQSFAQSLDFVKPYQNYISGCVSWAVQHSSGKRRWFRRAVLRYNLGKCQE